MPLDKVVNVAEKLDGKFQEGNGDLDFKSVVFGKDWIYFLVITEKDGLGYGAVVTSDGQGGEFLCCPSLPKCEQDEIT